MDEDRQNLRDRIEIVSAYVKALADPDRLLQVCAASFGDFDNAKAAVAKTFNVSELGARAILELQIRRFTPAAIEQVRSELADLNRRLREIDGSPDESDEDGAVEVSAK